MKLSAVLLARVFALIQVEDLNPRGKVFYPDIVKALVQKCGFSKYPTKIDEFDESKGVEFTLGKWDDTVIDKVVIYNTGIALDTRASTSRSEAILNEALSWLSDHIGLVSVPISRKAYLSQ